MRELLDEASTIKSEDDRAAALSESYDTARLALARAKGVVTADDARVALAESRLGSAEHALHKVAIVAYVTGELSEVNSPMLSSSPSSGEMTAVYSGAATSRLQTAVDDFKTLSAVVSKDRRRAVVTEASIRVQTEHLVTLRRQATAIIASASASYGEVRGRLLALLKKKGVARLFDSSPAGSPYKGVNLGGTAVNTIADRRQQLAAVASVKKYLGVPYVWGGASKKGVDCSGLTMLSWAAAGIELAHSATYQWEEAVPVPLDQLEPGDLLFYHFANDGNTPITHVVEYVGTGPYGPATAIQAAEPGTDVAYTPVYFGGLVGAGQP